MAASDDLLDDPQRLSAVRAQIETIVDELGARAGFLVDEEGTPFAAVGPMEFRLPHPLAHLHGGSALLGALVGEKPAETGDERYVVERVGNKALLALLLEEPLPAKEKRATGRRIRDSAKSIAKLL